MSAGVPYIKPLPIWTPRLLSTLKAWYDATDASTIIQSGGFVSQWNDKSGDNEHLTQVTGSAQPQTGVRSLNGLNVLDFDGGDFMSHSPFVAGLNMSVFMVAVIDAIDSANDAVFSTLAAKDFSLEAYNATQFDGRVYCVGASNPSPELSGGPFPGPSIYNAKVGTDNFRIQAYIDGTLRADGPYIGGISGSSVFNVFSCRNQTCQPDGAVAEIVVVTTATTTQRQLTEGYLAWKWGIQAKLPGGHPYETHPPFI